MKLIFLFRRALTDEEHTQLEQLLAAHLNSRSPEPIGSIGKGLIGTGVGLAASTAASEAVEEIKKLFTREIDVTQLLDGFKNPGNFGSFDSDALKIDLQARAPIGSVGKGLIGTGVGLAASTAASEAVEEIKKLFTRAIDPELLKELKTPGLIGSFDVEALENDLRARAPIGSVGKGLIGTGVGLAASTAASEAVDEIRKLFQREIELD